MCVCMSACVLSDRNEDLGLIKVLCLQSDHIPKVNVLLY